MGLTARLRTLETKLLPVDDVPGLLIVLEEEDGVWHDWEGAVINPATVDPRTQVIRFRLRLDGPQQGNANDSRPFTKRVCIPPDPQVEVPLAAASVNLH